MKLNTLGPNGLIYYSCHDWSTRFIIVFCSYIYISSLIKESLWFLQVPLGSFLGPLGFFRYLFGSFRFLQVPFWVLQVLLGSFLGPLGFFRFLFGSFRFLFGSYKGVLYREIIRKIEILNILLSPLRKVTILNVCEDDA